MDLTVCRRCWLKYAYKKNIKNTESFVNRGVRREIHKFRKKTIFIFDGNSDFFCSLFTEILEKNLSRERNFGLTGTGHHCKVA